MHPLKIGFIIATSLSPVLLSLSLYNAFDCNTQTNKNYQAWLDQGNKGSFQDMVNTCKTFHPMILYVLMPVSLIIGFISYRMLNFKPEENTKGEVG